MVRKRWYEVNEMDMGDVSEFEKPPVRPVVQIISCTGSGWYSDCIGQYFKVKEIPEEDASYYIVDGPGSARRYIVWKKDVKLIQESIDEVGDIGDFESPPEQYRNEQGTIQNLILITGADSDDWFENGYVFEANPPKTGSEIQYEYIDAHGGDEDSLDNTTELWLEGEELYYFLDNGSPVSTFIPASKAVKVNGWEELEPLPNEEHDLQLYALKEGVGDLGDVGDFEEPKDTKSVRFTKTGEVLEVQRFPNDANPNFNIPNYLIVEPEKYKGMIVGAEFVKPLKESIEDLDISEFEKPPIREEEIIRWWKSLYITMSPQDAARAVSRNLGISIEDVCEALRNAPADISYFVPVIRAQVKKGNFFDESIDDLGDTGDFEKPLTKKYRVLYKGTDGDRHIVHIEAPDDVNAGQQIVAIPDFLPTNLIEIEPMQEESDDIGDIGDFEEPYQSKLLKKFPNHSSDNKRLDYHLDMLMKGAEIDRDTGGVGMGVGQIRFGTEDGEYLSNNAIEDIFRFYGDDLEEIARWKQPNGYTLITYKLKGTAIREGADDLGDIGDFEKPADTMFVRITKSTNENSWYQSHIGEIFEVDYDRDQEYLNHYMVLDDGRRNGAMIRIDDCEPVSSIQESVEDDLGYVNDYAPLGDFRIKSKWPALIRNAIKWIQEEHFDQIDYEILEDGTPIIDLISNSTGEIRQMRGERADLLFSALDELGLLKSVGNSHTLVKNYDIRFKETTMEKRKRWYEANEVDPESGYIKEVPDPVEDLGDVSEFEAPEFMAATKELMQQPSYYDAWKYFSTHFHDFMQGRSGVPYGSGAFEMWWVGGPCAPDTAPSPQGTITKDDINELANEGGYQAEGSEVFGLFMNTFYNNALGAMMDLEVLTYLTQKAMQIAGHIGGEEQFEGFNVFRDLSDDERAELMGTKYAAKQVATQIKSDAQEKMNRKASMNREIQANGG